MNRKYAEQGSLDTDASLLRRVRAGEGEAMVALFDRHSALVYAVALRVLSDPSGAEDVVQDTFLRIWRNPPATEAQTGSLAGWFAVLARNRAIDQLRRRRPSESPDDVVLLSPIDAQKGGERMNGNDHIEVEDLAMFALLLLDGDEAGAVRKHLRECAGCREELLRVREDLATYALSVEPLELPGQARDRFLTSLNEEASSPNGVPARAADPSGTSRDRLEGRQAPVPQDVPLGRPALVPAPVPSREPSASSRLLPLLGWAGWAVAAAILLVALGLRQDRNALQSALAAQNSQLAQLQARETKARQLVSALTGPGAVRVNLAVPKAPALPSARAVYEPQTGTLLLTASHLAPLPAQKAYELWLIPADGGSPVPAGTFSPDSRGEASVLLPPLHGGKTAKAFGITMEPSSGSATPTLPILLAGAPA